MADEFAQGDSNVDGDDGDDDGGDQASGIGSEVNNEQTLRRAALEPCVAGATIAQERKWLELIRLLALDVDDTTLLAPGLRATEFAFLYVREDRTKRQANIRRCKENSKQRKLRQQLPPV